VERDNGCFAPTLDHNDSVNLIGHNNKGIQYNEWEMGGDVLQTTLGDFTSVVQPHLTIRNMTEQAIPFPRADRHEIRTGWQS
jgi:hypothetical protein